MYKVCSGLEAAAGFVTDESPIPDETLGPELPDSDRTGLTLGLNIATGGHTGISVGYMHLMPKDRDVENLVLPTENIDSPGVATLQNGTYKNSAMLLSIGLNHTF
jgi:long-chain fatty acid transport protein